MGLLAAAWGLRSGSASVLGQGGRSTGEGREGGAAGGGEGDGGGPAPG